MGGASSTADLPHHQGDDIPSDQLGAAIFLEALSGQPPPFRPTKKGLNVNHPDFPATKENSNAFLSQTDGYTPDPTRPHLAKIYLFVDSVETSWSLEGSYGQAQVSRTFYPHSFIQHEWIIKGQMANQTEYDKLVEFVEWHQQRALYSDSEAPGGGIIQVRSALFALYKPANTANEDFNMIRGLDPAMVAKGSISQGESSFRGGGFPLAAGDPGSLRNGPGTILVTVVIKNIEAGHERFVFAPAFTLTCEVVFDWWNDSSFVDPYLYQTATVNQVYGEVHNPSPINETVPSAVNTAPPGATSGAPVNTSPPGANQGNDTKW